VRSFLAFSRSVLLIGGNTQTKIRTKVRVIAVTQRRLGSQFSRPVAGRRAGLRRFFLRYMRAQFLNRAAPLEVICNS
jgi:hypothetical protein